jgi:hypothetical protein
LVPVNDNARGVGEATMPGGEIEVMVALVLLLEPPPPPPLHEARVIAVAKMRAGLSRVLMN